ncbi:PAS domain S-box protein [Filobacillus milosensis]|uniref:histidine kinase n=1 Tax=Filobacillus milosensis TaxID=94137 RepID=A0A4Y8IQK1_9BACI|nr:ATP-binding protein [Filobacillus milosensis]TFB23111.1 PAS domain S-box protein [Filobacillus milosensis]
MKKHSLVMSGDNQLDLEQGLLSSAFQWFDNNSTNIKLIFDENYKIVYISYSAEKILGYKKECFLGKDLLNFIDESDVENAKKYINSLGFDRINVELAFKNNDDHTIYTATHLGKINDDHKGKTYYIAVINDISELKTARKMLMNSEKLSSVGQLAASVVHEIRNPLTSIKGFLQLLENDVKDKPEYFNIMTEEIEKIESITTELLYIAKPSPNQFKNENITNTISEVCLLMKSQARLYDIQIDFKSDKDHYINCDRSQIKQVFINLIKNAVEAMESEGTIRVHVYKDDSLTIDVIDEGVGVPDDLKLRLGEPFLSTKEKGTGLGLMVTKQILNNHHASLNVLDNKEKGSIFRVRFY